MNTIGIISEYNPFHAGHLHHIAETKKRFPHSIIVAVMSGNFVQRGEAAVLNKWDRAEIAVKNGVNLVVELPTYYAVSAAPDFAKGAMDVLGQLHATHFSFGSEIDNPDALSALSDFTGTEAYNKKVKEGLAKGLSYPAATAAAGGPILPNALLATEYLKHANGICPILIPRASNHSSLELHACASQENAPRDLPYPVKDTAEVPVYSSAKAIRHALSGSEKISVLSAEKKLTELTGVNYIGLRSHRPQPDTRHLDSDRFPSSLLLEAAHINTMYALILYRIRTSSAEELRNIRGMEEGLENRIIRAALRARSFEELIALCGTKRFSTARIKRTLIAILLQICPMREPSSKGEGGYIRVLAFDNEGKKILSRIRDEGKTEIITKESKTSCENLFFKLDKRAAAVYATIKGEQNLEHSALPYYNQGLQV